jgi:hypothetical protein
MYKIFIFSAALLITSLTNVSAASNSDYYESPNIKNVIEILDNGKFHCGDHHKHKKCVCPQGATGPRGLKGPSGSPGARGIQGSAGHTGPQGPTGIPGKNGQTVNANFASLRTFKPSDVIPAGNPIPFSPGQDTVYSSGSLQVIPLEGSVEIFQAGNYQISFGISGLKAQKAEIHINGIQQIGSILASAKDGQMTSLTISRFIDLLNGIGVITFIAGDDLTLVQGKNRDVTAYLEVIQLDNSPVSTMGTIINVNMMKPENAN